MHIFIKLNIPLFFTFFMTLCEICGEELTDPEDIQLGSHKECRDNLASNIFNADPDQFF